MPIVGNAANTSTNEEAVQNTDEATPRFKEWFKKRSNEWKENRKQQAEEASRPSYEDNLKVVLSQKAVTLVERSMILAIEQVVAEKSLGSIAETVNKVYDRYGSFVTDPNKIEVFSRYTIDEMTKEIFISSYQEILNKAHGIATGNLAKWSKDTSINNSLHFNNEYKLYDLMINDIKDMFKTMADPKNGKGSAAISMGLIRGAIVNKLNQVAALKFSGENIRTDLVATQGKSSKKTGEKTISGMHTSIIIDVSEGSQNKQYTSATVEIPEIDLKEVFAQNPETLKYKLRKPVAGITHFASQSILFNIPLFFVTVAMVGLDSAKNPRALDQFLESLKDPVVHMGFGMFMLTNHRVAVGFHKIIKNPKLRFMAGPIGMAAGILAQSVFTELWNDKNLRGCARSLYDPQPENGESCNKFWNDWILTNKISQYTPAIMGLLSTALAAGFIQKFGGSAVQKSIQAVSAAEAELASLMKQAIAEDPMAQTAKNALNKSLNKAASAADKIKKNKEVQSMIKYARQKLENARSEAKLIQESAGFYKDYAADGLASLAKGRLKMRITGLWAVAKDTFKTRADLNAYLLKLKKLKGLVNFSIVSIGANLVFLAVEPFISDPLNEAMGKLNVTNFNVKQFLENNTFADNIPEMISAFFSHKISLPHEKDFKTIPDIFDAYNTSLDYYLNHGFKGYDITKCYVGDPNKAELVESDDKSVGSWLPEVVRGPLKSMQKNIKGASSWMNDSTNAVKRYLFNQGLYFMNPECVVKSDFNTWLNKYSEAEKGWRTLALTQVISSSIAWSETISNFVINYETTHDFYSYMAGLIYDYKDQKNKNLVAELPESEITREAILNNVMEISKIPLKDKRSEDDQVRFEGLYPDKIGDFETPEYGDFMIASMACGPDPLQPVSFTQKLRSLSWLPWESVSHLAPSIFSTWQTIKPNSPIIETYPGTSFKYLPPRITTGDPGEICNSDNWREERRQGPGQAIYGNAIKTKMNRHKNLIEYIFNNVRADIITPTDIGDNTSKEVSDNFLEWNKQNSTKQIYDENAGVWPVVKKNYENLMKHHFFPVLNDSSLSVSCPGGGLHCGLTQDIYLRPNGLIYSGVNELYTYIRTLRKILTRLSQQSKKEDDKNQNGLKENFEQLSRQLIYSVLDTKIRNDQFDYSDLNKKLEVFRNLYLEALPNTPEAVSATATAELIFEKMGSVVGELEGYKKYSQLTFKKGELSDKPTTHSTGSAYDPRMKGHK